MRYLVLGVLACLCSGLAWAEVDETLGKSKATHINAQKLAKPSSKASPKLTPAELAKLATEKEIAQRRAAFVPTAAVATTAATATLSPAAAPLPNPALDAAAPATMPEAQAAVTGDVHVGRMVCELGNAVSVTPDPSRLGTYWVQMRQHRYHMTPVATSTGAVRLEDKQAGAMWLQLPHKSMLMNSKIGQRMADECQSAHQFDEASRMKSGPPSTLLDGPSFAKK
ncbi:hypothetical protein MCEMAEM4_03228 [Burkholderiaceae bacterium]